MLLKCSWNSATKKNLFGCILWYITSCRLFNAKSCLFMYIIIWFVSHFFPGYIIFNEQKLYCLHTIKWIHYCNLILVPLFIKYSHLIKIWLFVCTQLILNILHAVKWFQVLIFINCTQLNSSKYCYLTLIILFNNNHTSKRLNSSFWFIDGTLTSAGQSRPVSNKKK